MSCPRCQVMREFREGGYNTLVSTCIGEEGLDIGDVDLIVCFDAHKSPIRLVQRMGRTGRKRQGRIVMLVTQGKEEQVRVPHCLMYYYYVPTSFHWPSGLVRSTPPSGPDNIRGGNVRPSDGRPAEYRWCPYVRPSVRTSVHKNVCPISMKFGTYIEVDE